MTIYVGPPKTYFKTGPNGKRRRLWMSRLFTDPTSDLSGLISFAELLGLPADALNQGSVLPHYDIGMFKRDCAIDRSAVTVSDIRTREIEQAWRRYWNEHNAD